MTFSLPLLLRAALLFASFCGLSATARRSLKLNRFIAPFFAACAVIVVMMAAGMLGALKAGFMLLYAAGFAGCIYTYLIKKTKPDLPMIGLFALLCGYLYWRLNSCHLFLNDDFSHWGLAARHLLEMDRFPDSNADLIAFQSYPLGATSFIYYICRTLGNYEGMWMMAHSLLHALMILPAFACMEKNRRLLAPVVPVAFLLLFKASRPMESLCVDWLLSSAGIGMAGAALYYRRNLPKAFWTVLPGIIALVYFKSSGIFFAVCTAALLFAIAHRCAPSLKWKVSIPAIAAAVGAFLLWSLHVKLSFPAGFDTKHAVSLSAYAQQASSKSLMVVLAIAKQMVLAWLIPAGYQVFSVVVAAFFVLLTLYIRRIRPHLRTICGDSLKGLAACAGVYILWFIMLYAMYVFSMPGGEALRIAAFGRYNSTGLMYACGLGMIVMFLLLSKVEFVSARPVRVVCITTAVAALCLTSVQNLDMDRYPLKDFYPDLFVRSTELPYYRAAPQQLLRENDIPAEGGNYIVYAGDFEDADDLLTTCYCFKFDLRSNDMELVLRETSESAAEKPYLYQTMAESFRLKDPIETIADRIDQCDAVLICKDDPVFQARFDEFLAGYTGDTPILYAY